MSTLPDPLVASYRQACYRVDAPGHPIELQIGQRNEPLARLFAEIGMERAAFITACNPGSRQLPEPDNVIAQRTLLLELKQRNHHWLKGVAVDPQGAWPQEASVLVLGMGLEEAAELTRRYGQNGFVYCDADAVPQLILNY